MAKRKRLDVPTEADLPVLETKSAITPRARMPIADVAGDTAGQAALEEIAREMTRAEDDGRVIKKLPLDKIVTHHLARDRMVLEEEDMVALMASIEARGQQTPIEVVRLPGDMFGLISGLRRVAALERLDRTEVLALIKRPETSQAAYQAMIEENEMRANLSFFERAQIAVAATGQGVYPDARTAVRQLFAHAPRAKRSKILTFVTLCEALGPNLAFPTAIPEHLGLQLVKAIEADPGLAKRLVAALREAGPKDASEERAVLEQALKAPVVGKPAPRKLAPGLQMESRAGRAVLSGKAVDATFLEDLAAWAAARAPS